MLEATPRLALSLLSAGQAQKELTHNEALLRADMLIQPVVQAVGVATPPTAPASGQCWIIGASATGVWSGHDANLACWTEAGWRFVAPFAGLMVLDASSGQIVRYSLGGWVSGTVNATQIRVAGTQVIGTQQAAISNPSGGATIDAEARITLATILSALRSHGLIAT